MRRAKEIGGQAVIEGVMLKDDRRMVIAVRATDGRIVTESRALASLRSRFPWLRWPVLRGVAALVETVSLGVWALITSANLSSEDEGMTWGETVASVGIAVIMAVGLFVILPTVAVGALRRQIVTSPLGLNLLEGLVRVLVLVLYVAAISLMPDIRRVLQYHGAEHQVIHAWERGAPLTAAQAARFPLTHPRCGTSFLLQVALVSVFVYSIFGWPSLAARLILRLCALPVVAGLAYEVLRWGARGPAGRNAWNWPGKLLQRLTTRRPDDHQLEVALVALRALVGGKGT